MSSVEELVEQYVGFESFKVALVELAKIGDYVNGRSDVPLGWNDFQVVSSRLSAYYDDAPDDRATNRSQLYKALRDEANVAVFGNNWERLLGRAAQRKAGTLPTGTPVGQNPLPQPPPAPRGSPPVPSGPPASMGPPQEAPPRRQIPPSSKQTQRPAFLEQYQSPSMAPSEPGYVTVSYTHLTLPTKRIV